MLIRDRPSVEAPVQSRATAASANASEHGRATTRRPWPSFSSPSLFLEPNDRRRISVAGRAGETVEWPSSPPARVASARHAPSPLAEEGGHCQPVRLTPRSLIQRHSTSGENVALLAASRCQTANRATPLAPDQIP